MKDIARIFFKKNLRVIGLMSGTSMDGLNVCVVDISRNASGVEIANPVCTGYTYNQEFKEYLHAVVSGSTAAVCQANFAIGREYAGIVRRFLHEHNISVASVDLVGSHGQTVWHIDRQATLQIGEPSMISEAFDVPVVSDFRVRDIAAGGTGAPLVPFIDFLLFKKFQKTFMVLNLGGIANFTIVPRGSKTIDEVFALDTGPGNILCDTLVKIITGGVQNCDTDGRLARRGTIRGDILQELREHPYIKAPLPKSTGPEVFGPDLVWQIIARHRIEPIQYYDLLATFSRFSAEAVFLNYQQFFTGKYPLDEIIASGGGVHNPVIMEHLQELFSPVAICSPEAYGIPGDGKEALAFAMLSALYVWQIPGNVPNVTGARHPVVLGKLTL